MIDKILQLFPIAVLSLFYFQLISLWMDQLYKKNAGQLKTAARLSVKKYRWLLAPGFFGCLLWLGQTSSFPLFFRGTGAAIFLLAICATDFEQQLIFDRMLFPFALLGLLLLPFSAIGFTDALLAGCIGGGAFLLLAVLTHGAIGGGDIKLIFVLGLWLGTGQLYATILIGLVLGGLAALLLLITRQRSRRDFFAYGPWFALPALYLLLS